MVYNPKIRITMRVQNFLPIALLVLLIGCDGQTVVSDIAQSNAVSVDTDRLLDAHDFTQLTEPFIGAALPPLSDDEFVNWESPHVYPLDMTPDGRLLIAANTANSSIEVFDITTTGLEHSRSVPVGLDPVSVRVRTNSEVWVVNHMSDSVSIVDLDLLTVTGTLQTDDEPADVVFAGNPARAFVSNSQSNTLQVFDTTAPAAAISTIELNGEDPRALAVAPDGNTVYAAFFESGNATTIIGGTRRTGAPGVVIEDPNTPYGGISPPPNNGNEFLPAINPDNPPAPTTGMIVRKNQNGRWFDDNDGDWSDFISGQFAPQSGRIPGWNMPDRDVAQINANTLQVSYQSGVMNALMAMAVNPTSGEVTVVGTDAINEVRFEPNLNGRFIHVNLGAFQPGSPTNVTNLNDHIDNNASFLPASERVKSLGDPRGIAWLSNGNKAFVSGMGSNNLIVIDRNGQRDGLTSTIPVGQGPTGVVLNEASETIYVLNKFDATISVVDMNTETEINQVEFYDPTPLSIKQGRPHLYDTHKTSGTGHISCASCHIDARHDRLAWDLGDPSGSMDTVAGLTFHPMKGPMRSQTLIGIVTPAKLHWRGDREDLLDFAPAFTHLQGMSSPLTLSDMVEMEAFIGSIHTPPNPFRNLDNSLPNAVAIPGPGNRVGNPNNESSNRGCAGSGCHDRTYGGRSLNARPNSGNQAGDQHAITPSLRNMQELMGLHYNDTDASNAGFGFIGDGSFSPTTQRTLQNDDNLAFMMTYNGDLDGDTHAAVGQQITASAVTGVEDLERLDDLIAMADEDVIGLIAHGILDDQHRGFYYIGDGVYQSDVSSQRFEMAELFAAINDNSILTFTAVPKGTEQRAGVDTNDDGIFNGSGERIDAFVAGWSFDENQFGAGSNGIDDLNADLPGTAQGDVTSRTENLTIQGVTGTCSYAEFDGNGDYISFGNPDALNFSGEITLSAWIRPDRDDQGIRNILAHTHQQNPNRAVYLRVWNGRYQVGSWTETGDHLATANIAEGDVGSGEWVHLAGTYDGQTWRLYRNGQQIALNNNSVGAVRVDQDWTVGAFGDGSRQFFDGGIDEPRIFSFGLNAEEIVQLMNSTHPCETSSTPGSAEPNDNPDNLFTNGGFETGLDSWGFCGPINQVNHVSSNQFAGRNAVNVFDEGCIFQEVPASVNDDLTLSCQISQSTNGFASLSLNYLDENFNTLDVHTAQIDQNSDYQDYRLQAIAPNGTAHVSALLYSEANTLIDACELVATADAQPPLASASPELLSNGDFENNLNNWTACAASNLATLSQDTDSGNGALAITNEGCMFQEFDTTPGENYTMQCRAKSENTNDFTSLTFSMLNSNFEPIAQEELSVDTLNFASYTANLTAPANTQVGSVVMYSEDVGVFDNCSVVERP